MRSCTHAVAVGDDELLGEPPQLTEVRRCLLCGLSYDRDAHWRRLELAIRARYRLPRSPWSAAERAEDCA